MASLKSIKSKIISYKKTGTVTHAMEAVSAVKMRKGQERALSGRAYAAAALSILERLAGTPDAERHPLAQEQTGKTCFIVITSDKGLAGALNSAVIRRAEHEILSRGLVKNDVEIMAFGKRGGDFFQARGYATYTFTNANDNISENELAAIISAIFVKGTIASVFVVYQNFISTFEQEPTIRQIIPITTQGMREIVAGIRPARGKYSPQSDTENHSEPAAYTIEPDADAVIAELLPKLVNIAVFHAMLESKASEHSARMVAMKSATDKAKEMAQDLTRTFNKVRQAAITREVSEITSGIEAMK